MFIYERLFEIASKYPQYDENDFVYITKNFLPKNVGCDLRKSSAQELFFLVELHPVDRSSWNANTGTFDIVHTARYEVKFRAKAGDLGSFKFEFLEIDQWGLEKRIVDCLTRCLTKTYKENSYA